MKPIISFAFTTLWLLSLKGSMTYRFFIQDKILIRARKVSISKNFPSIGYILKVRLVFETNIIS